MLERTAISTSDVQSERVADTVIMLALMLARIGSDGLPSLPTLAGRTLGLVGFDAAANAVARRAAHGFGMRVLMHGEAAGISGLDQLLAEADVVSLHGRPGHAPALDAHRLNQMKPDACLINASHGALVDEQALIHALWFETIGGAGIAVPAETLDRSKDFEASENAIVLQAVSRPPSPVSAQAAPGIPDAMPAPRPDNVIRFPEGRQHG